MPVQTYIGKWVCTALPNPVDFPPPRQYPALCANTAHTGDITSSVGSIFDIQVLYQVPQVPQLVILTFLGIRNHSVPVPKRRHRHTLEYWPGLQMWFLSGNGGYMTWQELVAEQLCQSSQNYACPSFHPVEITPLPAPLLSSRKARQDADQGQSSSLFSLCDHTPRGKQWLLKPDLPLSSVFFLPSLLFRHS